MKKYCTCALISLSLLFSLSLQAQQPQRDLIPPGGQNRSVHYQRIPVQTTLRHIAGKSVHSANTTPRSNATTHVFGRTAGQLSVSPSGAARYSIPIEVPPGIEGVVPKLSLQYDSHAKAGMAGYGWNLSGLSSISRVGATPIRDGFKGGIALDADDRFALDGQRLLLKSGTYGKTGAVYQTENQRKLKIESLSDTQFLVTYPNGARAWYKIPDSVARLRYPITRWEDAQGNFITYTYAETDHVQRITSIQYGGNGSADPIDEVKFNYTGRYLWPYSYAGGRFFQNRYMLTDMQVYAKGSLFRKYTLTYDSPGSSYDNRLQYNRLLSIQESNGDGKTLPITSFSYAPGSSGIAEVVNKSQFSPGFSDSRDRLVVGDYDGNGKTDILYYDKSERDKLNILLGVGDKRTASAYELNMGHFDDVFAATILSWNGKVLDRQAIAAVSEDDYSNLSIKTYTMGDSGPALQYEKLFWAPRAWSDTGCGDSTTAQATAAKIPKEYVSGDFNGDGLTDMLMITKPYAYKYCEACSRKYARKKGTLSNVMASQNNACLKTKQVDTSYVSFLDLNRKLPNYATKDLGTLSIPYKGGKEHLYAIEFDGDGKTDLLQIAANKLYVYGFNRDNSKFILKYKIDDDSRINTNYPILFGDYNGDGKTDFMVPYGQGDSGWYIYFSTGRIYHDWSKISIANYDNSYRFFTQDINGDGKADFVSIVPSSSYVTVTCYSNFIGGSNNFYALYSYNVSVSSGGAPVFWDASKANGSLPEFGYLNGNNYTSLRMNNDLKQSTKITKIDEGGQLTKRIYYQALNETPSKEGGKSRVIYTKDYDETYPFVSLNTLPGFRVVTQIQETDGHSTRTQKFSYGGAVSHAKGLGFLGFKTFSHSNFYGVGKAQEALWTTTSYSPQLRGAPTNVLTTDSPTQPKAGQSCISHTGYTYHTQLRSDKVFINQPTEISTQDTLKGTITTQTFTYDDYGNTLSHTTDYNGQGSKSETFIYEHHPEGSGKDYYIGRVKKETQTSTIGGNAFSTSKTYTYDSSAPQLPVTVVKRGNGSQALTHSYRYDAFGHVIQETTSGEDVTARSTKTAYDASGRFVSSQTDIEGLTTTLEHDPATGTLTKKTDPFGMATTYAYDGWQRMTKKTDYLQKSTDYNYSRYSSGYLVYRQNEGAPDTKTWYDGFGQKVKTAQEAPTGSKWIATTFKYDDVGHLIAKSQPYYERSGMPQWDNFTYDKYGRLTHSYLYTGKTIQTTYDGLTTTVNDGTQTKRTTKDALGNTIEVSDPGGSISYTYHGNGEMKTADYGGYIIQEAIDQWGRKSKLTDPSAGTYTYQHDILGELLVQTTPKGKTTYTYDAYGKKLSKKVKGDLTDMDISYQYDPKTKLLKQITGTNKADGSGTYTYTYEYDKYNRLTSKTEDNSKAKFIERYTYDAYGRKATEHTEALNKSNQLASKADISFAYDGSSGTLMQIKDHNTDQLLWKLTGTNARGQTTSFAYGNGITAKYAYDTYGFPSRITHSKGNSTVLDNTYQFDPRRGNLMSRENMVFGKSANFAYDNLDRLTHINGALTQAYNPSGKIKQNTSVGNYVYGAGNSYQLEKIALNKSGQAHYKAHALQQISYNAAMAPVAVYEEGHGRLSFDYNPLESRSHAYYGSLDTTKTLRPYQKHYSADGRMEILEDKKNNRTKFITWLDGSPYNSRVIWMTRYQGKLKLTDSPYYLHRDYQGSILAITSFVIASYYTQPIELRHFSPWGTLDGYSGMSGVSTNRGLDFIDRGYTGHEHFFGVGLIHMNGRMYDPVLHRFLSPDNYVQAPFNTQNFNRYGYVLNNPLVYNDPSGEWFGLDDLLGAVIGGVANLVSNIVSGNLSGHGFWGGLGRGLASFGVGAVAGDAALYGPGGWVAGGAIVGSTNAWLSGAHGWDIVKEGAIGGVAGLAGGAAGQVAARGLTSVAVSALDIGSPVARGAISGVLGTAGASYGGGFAAGYLETGSISQANEYGLHSLETAAPLALSMGVSSGLYGYHYAKTNNLNPWSGKPLGGNETTYTFTKSVVEHHLFKYVKSGKNAGQLRRPYMRSPLTIREIMSVGEGVPDAKFEGGMNWRVPGSFRGSEGTWELGINPKTNVVYHFNFRD